MKFSCIHLVLTFSLSVMDNNLWESKDGAQPCGFTLASFVVDRIRVSSELPLQSYSYGPEASNLFSGYLICLLPFELARFCPCIYNLRFMSLLTSSGYLDIQLKTKILKITHDLAFLGLLCFLFQALLKVFNQFSVNWFRFVILMCRMHVNVWLRGFSFCEFVVTILFGNFVQHDWHLNI